MKTHTPDHKLPVVKLSPRKRKAAAPATPPPVPLILSLPAVPTVWKRAAKDLGFQSVEEWAAAALDIISWPGNRMMITTTHEQLDRWEKAGRAQGLNFYAWFEATLDAASEAVNPQTSPQS